MINRKTKQKPYQTKFIKQWLQLQESANQLAIETPMAQVTNALAMWVNVQGSNPTAAREIDKLFWVIYL